MSSFENIYERISSCRYLREENFQTKNSQKSALQSFSQISRRGCAAKGAIHMYAYMLRDYMYIYAYMLHDYIYICIYVVRDYIYMCICFA